MGAAVGAARLAPRPGHPGHTGLGRRRSGQGQRHPVQRVPRGGQRAHGVSGLLPQGGRNR